jgi:long-chain acyl-CoA synthetase
MNVEYLVDRASRLYGGRPAITCGDRTLTSDEVRQRTTRLANVLTGLGGRPGDRVGVILPNCAQFMEVEFACALTGLIKVALNVRLGTRDLVAALAAMEVTTLIFAGRYAEVAEQAAAELSISALLCVRLSDADAGAAAGLEYEAALAGAASSRPSTPPARPDSVHSLFCTSGTTGRPKGVILTQRAQISVAMNLLLEYGPVRPGQQILLPQPLSHGGGFFMLPYYISGGHCIVMESFSAAAALELSSRRNIEVLKIVPTMLNDLLAAGLTRTRDLRPQLIIYGAAPMPRDWVVAGIDAVGPVFAQLYGQAEAPMCITVLPPEDHVLDRPGAPLTSAGRPFRGVEVRIVDAAGADVEPGEAGEVIVAGEHVMSGYWKDPAQTATVLRGGYVHTRDMARMDEYGYLHLLGRTDDMIISGGFNIAPRVVEIALDEHPDISESTVIAVPHERLGSAVKAFVVVRAGAMLTTDEIIEYARPRLGMQRPREVEIVPRLPKNAYGKVVKSELPR